MDINIWTVGNLIRFNQKGIDYVHLHNISDLWNIDHIYKVVVNEHFKDVHPCVWSTQGRYWMEESHNAGMFDLVRPAKIEFEEEYV